MFGTDDIGRLTGVHTVDAEGHSVGTLGELFLDDEGRPRWAAVRTGLFGRRESFIPLDDADIHEGVLRIPYPKGMVKDAPHHDPHHDLDRALTEEEEAELHRYYDTTPVGSPLRRHVPTEEVGDGGELREERPHYAEPQLPAERGHFEAEGVLLHPDEEDQIRRNQLDFDGEAGHDRV